VLLTSGNKADKDERVLKTLLEDLQGSFYGDKGYIFQEKQVKLITKVRKNMSPEKLSKAERYFLGKRRLIETVLNTPDTEVIETSLSICGQASL
jgi:hypothetical protein